MGAEAIRRALQQRLGPLEIAELRHGDAAKGQSRSVVTQGNPFQSRQYVTLRECPPRGRDQ
jgi:hypothetical protein